MRYLESSPQKRESLFGQVSSLAHYDVLGTLEDRVKDTEPGGCGGLLEGVGVPGREAMRRLSVQGEEGDERYAEGGGRIHSSRHTFFQNK